MMKQVKLIYTLLLVAALPLMTACSSDDAANGGETPVPTDGKIQVHLRVSQAGTSTMRAWQDAANADDKEMMNVWTVVAVNNTDNKVAAIYACKHSGDPDQEVDQIAELPAAGSYRFYSFANMSPKVVMNLLGISGTGAASNLRGAGSSYGTTPATGGGNDNDNNSALGEVSNNGRAEDIDEFISDVNTYAPNKLADIAFDESTVTADAANAVSVNVAGNNFDLTTHNGFGATGIPMSNVQTITVNDNDNVELVVVRMMAKIELQVYNDKGSDVTVESFTLTDLTKNTDNNLMLLPNLTGHNTMNVYRHGDIQPNLNGIPGTGDLTLYPNEIVSATSNSTTAGTPKTFTFYVNESVKPTNAFSHFFLKIKLQGEAEERYVLIDDTGNTTTDDGKWDYIARNDYRIIPIVLDDYKLDMIPYDFPAIGVYPASVKEEDGLYTINFHDYGHFHLQPVVKKLSSTTGEVVPFTETAPTGTYSSTSWGLIGDDFANSWGSWTDATKETAYDNESADPAFYRKGYDTWNPIDGDEVGGEPKWYTNNYADRPLWDPAASGTYRPFILGYVADPEGTVTTDRKVYHEFSIYLYKEGMSAPRQMTYRLYMILDTDQMLYSRQFGAPRVRHTHGY